MPNSIRPRLTSLCVCGALLALCAMSAPAFATTYYVSPGGNDGSSGSQAAPWRSLAKANSTLGPGDAVIIAPGTYTDQIDPKNNGLSNSQRISYIGNLSNPSQVVVSNSIWLERAYISVKGVQATGFTMYYTSETAKAVHDSIAWCISTGAGWGSAGAKDCLVAHNTINGSIAFLMNNWYAGPPGNISSERDTLRGNVIHVGTITTKGFQVRGFTQYCVTDSNQIDMFFAAANGVDLQGRYLYNAYYNTFRDNSWRMEADGPLPGNQYTGFALRDSSHDNLFERDSMLCGVQSGYDIGGRLVNAGNSAWTGQCVNNTWRGCYFLTTGNTFTQDSFNNCTLDGCVFASQHSYGLYFLNALSNVIIRNCTIASWAGACMRIEGDPRPGGNQFYSNIFYVDFVDRCLSGKPVLFHGYATGFTQNNNLFFSRTAAAGVTASGQSLYWTSSNCSAPGPGTSWASATGNDINSKYGDPRFVNPNFLNFDPHLQAGSPAIGLGAAGSDAGAYPFAPAGPDVTPPATINNLTATMVSDQNVVMTWTAPGDDGTFGLASAYDLRYSTQPITDDASFNAATQVPTQPIPGGPGTTQSYVMMGLSAGTQYYFAIKARDEVNNWSALGKVLALQTQATDGVPPKAIGDLH